VQLNKFSKIAIFLVITVFLSVFFFYSKKGDSVSASWWNDSWHYRASVPVTNNTSLESGVYIDLDLDLSDTTKLQADCGDLRFLTSEGETLSYYINSGCGATTSSIHVNFSTFDAGSQNIYYYYGNPSADNGFSASDFSTEASDYTVGTVGDQEISEAPIAYWRLDEGLGTVAHDESSNENDGTITGASWVAEDNCQVGKCLSISALSDEIAVLNSNSLSPDNITVSAWLKTSASNVTIIDKGSDQYVFSLVSGKVVFAISTSSQEYSATSTASVNDNVWHYLSATYDSETIKIYIDGELNSSNASPSGSIDITSNDLSLATNFSSGFVDELKIYSYARSLDQIKQEYNAGLVGVSTKRGTAVSFGSNTIKSPFCPLGDTNCGAPTIFLKFDERSGLNTYDYSTNEINGTHGAGSASPSSARGLFNRAYDFDGDNDYVSFGDTTKTIKTFSFWIKSDSINEDIMDLDGGSHSISISAGTLIAGGFSSPTIYIDGIEKTSIDTNWHHISITTDTGILVDDFELGKINTSYFDGKIDNLIFYDYVRTQKQVLYDMSGWKNSQKHPIAYYKFDEGYGETINDVSGNENDGTASSSDSGTNASVTDMWTKQGRFGKAIEFDGTNDYLEFQNIDNIKTISFWLKATSTTESILDIDSETNTISVASGVVSTTGFSSPQIYVDGEIESSIDTGWHHLLISFSTGVDASIITLGKVGSNYFEGIIDDLKFFSYELSEAEIKNEYNQGVGISLGSSGVDSSGVPDNSAFQVYCVPGDSSTCRAPVGEWRFEKKNSSIAYDTSSNGNNGTVVGASTVRGNPGSALSFNGSSANVDVGDISQNVKTISFWFKPRTAGESIIDLDGGTHYLSTSANVISATGFSSPSIYINGIESTDVNTAWNFVVITTASSIDVNNLSIGKVSSNYYDGIIDELRFYDYVRTQAQISWDFNRGMPVASWDFHEGSGDTIHDNNANRNPGTINGATWETDDCNEDNCLDFDGVDDYVSVGDTGHDINAVSFWAKQSYPNNYFIDLDGGTSTVFLSGREVQTTGFSSPSIYIDGEESTTIVDDGWHNITVVSDTAIDVNNKNIGKVDTYYYEGFIDEVSLFNYPLSPYQVANNFNGGLVSLGTRASVPGTPYSVLADGQNCSIAYACLGGACSNDWATDTNICHGDYTKCVYDNGGSVEEYADTALKCSGDDYYRTCSSGTWGANNTCDTSPDYQVGGNPNYCQEQDVDACTDGVGCVPPGWTNINDGEVCDATEQCVGEDYYSSQTCSSGTCVISSPEDKDAAQSYCESTASGCTARTWFSDLGTVVGANDQCCGDDGSSDDFATYSNNITSSQSVSCRPCLDGVDGGASTLYGNGYYTGNLTSGTSALCYYGDITCNASSQVNGASATYYGNGYYSGNLISDTSLLCYYGNISCTDGSGANGTSATYFGNGYYAGNLGTSQSILCYHGDITCTDGSGANGTSATYYGNGYYSGNLDTDTSVLCYYGMISCTNGSGANGISATRYGNGYLSGSTCYWGDISCSDGASANGSSCNASLFTDCGYYADRTMATVCSQAPGDGGCYCETSCGNDSDCETNAYCGSDNVCYPSCTTSFTCGESCIDTRNDNVYDTVEIGTQCWFAENLDIGTVVTTQSGATNNSQIEKYCYNNALSSGSTALCPSGYGAYYGWAEAMQYSTTESAQGVCPSGWHIPDEAEFQTLEEYLGMCSGTSVGCSGYYGAARGTDEGSQLAGTASAWNDGALEQDAAFGSSGFNFKAGGGVYNDKTGLISQYYGQYGWITISSEINSTTVYTRSIRNTETGIYGWNNAGKIIRHSVRCLQD